MCDVSPKKNIIKIKAIEIKPVKAKKVFVDFKRKLKIFDNI